MATALLAALQGRYLLAQTARDSAPLAVTQDMAPLAVIVSDTTLAVELGDGDVKVVRRTNSQPVRSIKSQRPRIASQIS